MQDQIHNLKNTRIFHQNNINVLTMKAHKFVKALKREVENDDMITAEYVERLMDVTFAQLKYEKVKLAEIEGDIAELEVRAILQQVGEEMDAPDLAAAQALYTPRSI